MSSLSPEEIKLVDDSTRLVEKIKIRSRRAFKETWIMAILMIVVLAGGFLGFAVALGWSIGITVLSYILQNGG